MKSVINIIFNQKFFIYSWVIINDSYEQSYLNNIFLDKITDWKMKVRCLKIVSSGWNIRANNRNPKKICHHDMHIVKEMKRVTPCNTSRNLSEIISLYKTPLTKRRLYTSIRSMLDDRDFKFHTRVQTLY